MYREEKRKLEEKELLVDKAPIISASTTPILEDTALRISTEKLEKVEKVSVLHHLLNSFLIIKHVLSLIKY